MCVLKTVVENNDSDSLSGQFELAINLDDVKVHFRFANGAGATVVLQ
jgi:hypothetical protein